MLFTTGEVTNCELTVRILDLSITKWTLFWAGGLLSLARRLATLEERKKEFLQSFRPNCMRKHGLSFRFHVPYLGYTSRGKFLVDTRKSRFEGACTLQSAVNKLEAERAEVESVLTSGVLGRTNNLGRFLRFVCEKYFEGTIDEVKEYSIAVQALGRPHDFDPQVDTIVRVTAHTLRKRLEDYYRTA